MVPTCTSWDSGGAPEPEHGRPEGQHGCGTVLLRRRRPASRQVIQDPEAQQPHKCKGYAHTPGEGSGCQGDTKEEDEELEDPPLEPESEELPVPLPGRDLKVGVLQMDRGKPFPLIDGLTHPGDRQHLALQGPEITTDSPEVQNGTKNPVPLRNQEVAGEKPCLAVPSVYRPYGPLRQAGWPGSKRCQEEGGRLEGG